ncbi:hypothetical protein [Ascidiimonas aurantiaca]|uniref:hypothetical protein n=1 Tax=Ascidiimonas aurantiaca TaxID=1685432 RepID=UPI0030EBADA8
MTEEKKPTLAHFQVVLPKEVKERDFDWSIRATRYRLFEFTGAAQYPDLAAEMDADF